MSTKKPQYINSRTTFGEPWHALSHNDEDGAQCIDTSTRLSGHQGIVSVKWFGAVGDGETLDQMAIQQAIDAAGTGDGGIVFFPAGTYLVRNIPGQAALDITKNKVSLLGEGMGATTIQLEKENCAHILNCTGVDNISISDLTIRGDLSKTPYPIQGICVKDVHGLNIERVNITDVGSSGILLQNSRLKKVFIRDVIVQNTGGNGIDIKNFDNENDQIVLSNILVENPGQIYDNRAGIDIWGPATLDQIFIVGLTSEGKTTGIRFRANGLGSPDGTYRHTSSLNNFQVICERSSTELTINAPDVRVANGVIQGGQTGAYIQDLNVSLSNVMIYNAECGIEIAPNGNDTTIENSLINHCETGIFVEGNYTSIVNSCFRGCGTYGVHLSKMTIGTRLIYCNILSSGILDILDEGVNPNCSKPFMAKA